MPNRNTVVKEGTTQNAKENEEHTGKPDKYRLYYTK